MNMYQSVSSDRPNVSQALFYSVTKRVCDLIVAGVALLALSPLLLVVATALRFTGEREVFYRQKRLGFKNRSFDILKFATMLKNSPAMAGGEITLRGDPRITRLGGWLRRTKINELPQLLNVLRGEMSIVGPRPLMQISFQMYSDEVQGIVYDSKPGLTGIASLVFRDEEALVTNSGVEPRAFYRSVIYPYKGQLESWYNRRKSLFVDLTILALTPLYVVMPNTNLVFTVFPDLPRPPYGLAGIANAEKTTPVDNKRS